MIFQEIADNMYFDSLNRISMLLLFFQESLVQRFDLNKISENSPELIGLIGVNYSLKFTFSLLPSANH
jgi:hypothetical protein